MLLISIVVAIAAAVLAGLLAGTLSVGRARAWLSLLAGGLFTVCMLVVTVSLTREVWASVEASTERASAPPGSSAAGKDGGGTDATANAIAAISATVAVVTLLLSLGTTWLGEQMRKVATLEDQLEAAYDRLDRQRELQTLRAQAVDALVSAKDALSGWFAEEGVGDHAGTVQEWALRLEKLMSSRREIRLDAFGDLLVLDRRKQSRQPVDPQLEPVVQYTLACHELALAELEQQLDPPAAAPRRRPAVVVAARPALTRRRMIDLVDEGLWCRVFDLAERSRYYRYINRS